MQINHKNLENNTDLSVKKSFTVCKQTISKSLINQATRKKVVMQSPHPIYFLKTEKQHNYCAEDSFFLKLMQIHNPMIQLFCIKLRE